MEALLLSAIIALRPAGMPPAYCGLAAASISRPKNLENRPKRGKGSRTGLPDLAFFVLFQGAFF
jgi:hypothetical protein